MKMRHFVLLMLLWGSAPALARVGLTASYGIGSLAADALSSWSLGVQAHFPVLNSERVQVGAGIRHTHISRSAGLDLGSSKEWSVDRMEVDATNLFGVIRYQVSASWSVGINLDLLGVSRGRSATLRSLGGLTAEAEPAGTNTFLFARNDRGTLNSEFFAAYGVGERFRLRAGLSHQVVEYETDSPGVEKLQRFYDLFFAGADFDF